MNRAIQATSLFHNLSKYCQLNLHFSLNIRLLIAAGRLGTVEARNLLNSRQYENLGTFWTK
jgi:hypothetical protein